MPQSENSERIQLGTGPHDTNANIDATLAPRILQILWRDHREIVGGAIGEAYSGARYRARRAPRDQGADQADEGGGQ